MTSPPDQPHHALGTAPPNFHQLRDTTLWLEGWGFPTLDSLTEFRKFFHSRGSRYDETGYANPRVDELIDEIQGSNAMIEEVWKIVLGDLVYLPLHQQILVWAMRDDLDIPVFPIGRPQFREARFR